MKSTDNLYITPEQKFLTTISIRDVQQATEIINDIPTRRFQNDAEWIATDQLEVYAEDLQEEILWRLDQNDISYDCIIIDLLD